ncbi:MAG TPA: F0F1 ATP synthase subunit gamma [Xanthomonadales bacterium]|nr:F0F1 ATP synthase subunit gamma [Xanthomonadales bacterium]
MAEDKKLQEEIAINKDFGLLTRSYQEHAIGQINFARYYVLYSRDFSKDLEEIFSSVRTSYFRKSNKKTIKNMIKKNGRDIWILVAANNKLYGDIILKTVRLFITKLKDTDPAKVDLVIIGRQGKNMVDQENLNRPYDFFDVPDTSTTGDFLKKLSNKLASYENVIVFFGKYNNLISQTPAQIVLSGDVLMDEAHDSKLQIQQNFLFEPGIEEILSYFENQILSLLLNQTVQEAQLARFASRVNAMEIAQDNIQKQLDKLKRQEKRIKIMETNKKQTELLAGRWLWNRG